MLWFYGFIVWCYEICALQTFYQSDLGQKGYLSRQDVKAAVIALFGYKPSKVWSIITRLVSSTQNISTSTSTRTASTSTTTSTHLSSTTQVLEHGQVVGDHWHTQANWLSSTARKQLMYDDDMVVEYWPAFYSLNSRELNLRIRRKEPSNAWSLINCKVQTVPEISSALLLLSDRQYTNITDKHQNHT